MSVSELLQRLQAFPPGAPLDWRKIREEIHEEHERATTTADRDALLAIFKSVMDAVERGGGFTPEDMEKFKKARRQDYCAMLIREALVGEYVCPQKIEAVTRREVEAGRMAPDDDFRELAVAGATILTSSRRPEEKQRAKPTLAVRLGNMLYWLGCGLACAILALGGIVAYADKQGSGVPFFVTAMVAAVLVWLVGRACRYVLSGN